MTHCLSNNQRIARNTVFLYFRTLVIMLVSLFTSRVLLRELGETDFGIYNLVGGIVVLFTFLNSAMSTATQRFLNIELGRNNRIGAEHVFCMSMNAHVVIALLVLILAETIGLWFVSTQLNIPSDRYIAMHWVYQFSVIGVCANIIRIPYNAAIIAYEKMGFFAKVSLLEAVLKLSIVYMLIASPIDKLIYYSALMLIVIIITNCQYYIFCRKKTDICEFHRFWDKDLFLQLFNFTSWSVFGSASTAFTSQGINIFYNIFCGVVVNAAMGITNQVFSAVSSFVANYQLAFAPQLTKYYAANDNESFCKLIKQASRFSYYLIFIIGLPCVFCCDIILKLWLVDVPKYTVEFTQLMIIYCLVETTSGPIWTAIQATGKIKNYQILISSIILLNLPLAFLLLKLGFSPVFVVMVRVIINSVAVGARLTYLSKTVVFPTKEYIIDVLLHCFVITCVSVPVCYFMTSLVSGTISGMLVFLGILIVNIFIVLFIGLKKSERLMIRAKIIQIIMKK